MAVEKDQRRHDSISVPFLMNKKDQKKIWKDKKRPYLTLKDIDKEFWQSREIIGNRLNYDKWPVLVEKFVINNRTWSYPLISIPTVDSDSSAALRALIDSIIFDKCESKVTLSELEVTSEWQYGLGLQNWGGNIRSKFFATLV